MCFEGVFSNPGLYCTVVQLEVKQLLYCHCKSHIKVTMRPSMKHKQILNSEKRKKNKITGKNHKETNTHNKQNPICEQGITDEKHQKPQPENVLVPNITNMYDNVPKSKMTF